MILVETGNVKKTNVCLTAVNTAYVINKKAASSC